MPLSLPGTRQPTTMIVIRRLVARGTVRLMEVVTDVGTEDAAVEAEEVSD